MKKIFKNGLFEFAANTLYGERSKCQTFCEHKER